MNEINVCTKEHPQAGHQKYWRYSSRYPRPACGKCGLVVESESDIIRTYSSTLEKEANA